MKKQKESGQRVQCLMPEVRREAHAWLRGFKTVSRWLEEVKSERTGSERTQLNYLDEMRHFMDYMQLAAVEGQTGQKLSELMEITPDTLVQKAFEEQKREMTADAPVTKTWAERMALKCFAWVQNSTTSRRKVKLDRVGAKTVYGGVRSFFRHNGINFKGKTPIAQTQTHVRLPSNEQLTQAWKIASLPQKLAVGILRSTIWRPEDALALTYGDLQDQYDPQRYYIEKVTQKEQLPVGVYLTAETTEIVRLNMRKRYGDAKPNQSDRMLDYNYNNLLIHVQNFGKNADLPLSPKYFRKMGRTRCAPIIGQDAVFKMAGWTLPGVGRNYVLPAPEETLKCYLQIETLLTFEPKATTEKEQQIENLIMGAIAQGILRPERATEMRAVFRVKALTPEEAAMEIRKEVEKEKLKEQQSKTAINGGCLDGVHCQRVVLEEDLPELFAQGWRVAAVLPSGKIVISNE